MQQCAHGLLISDEVLAVGDESFQRKCIEWLEDYLQHGGTLLLVSHNLFQVQKLCHSAYWLRDGQVEREGDVFEVCQAYLAYHQRRVDRHLEREVDNKNPHVTNLTLCSEDREDGERLVAGQHLFLSFDLHCRTGPRGIRLGLFGMDGNRLVDLWHPLKSRVRTRHRLQLDTRGLMPGRYQLELAVAGSATGQPGSSVRRLLELTGRTREFGAVRLPHQWSVWEGTPK